MKLHVAAMAAGIALLIVLVALPAHASGTAAGTAISNQASVNYNAGSNARNATSNTVTLYVANMVAGAYSPPSRTDAGVDNRMVYYPVSFVNQGNRSDAFTIAFNANTGYTVAMINDLNKNGVFDAGEPVITSTGTLQADSSIAMLVRVTIAAGRPDAEAVTITATLTSTAANDPPNHITVVNPGATFGFSIAFTVHKPVIAFSATQSDVTANAARIPGASVTYTMSLANTGSGAVSGTSTTTFILDPHMKYVSSTQSGALSGADGNGNGGTVTWTFAQALLAPAASAIPIAVVVQPEQVTNNGTGVASGTTVYAMTTGNGTETKVTYSDGVNGYSADNANSFNFAVGSASGTVITQVTPDGSGSVGDSVSYHYTLKNTGNHSDGFDLTQADGGGSLNVAHVFSLTSGGAAVTSVTAVAQGATVDFYARVTIPGAAVDGNTIKRSLTATTQTATPTAPTGGTTSSAHVVTTTVTAPSIAISLAGGESDIISGGVGGHAVPGTVMRWTVTITNTGAGTATSISASNLNAHLGSNTIVPGSFDIDPDGSGTFEIAGVGNGYSSGGITITTSGGIATVTFTSIAAGHNCKYRYNVAVQ